MTNKISDDFMEAMANYKNPKTLFEMAKTNWQKAVALQFVSNNKRMDKQDNDMKWVTWLVRAIFGIGILGLLIDVIPRFFGV